MAVWALAGALTSCQQNRPVAVGAEDAEPVTVSETKLPDNRMVYPWSVVPGGVDSPQAMGQAIQADPVVAAHYAGLRPEAFRAEQFTEKKEGYVSYRIRDKIYWTRRMVTLAAGERVLTDGTTLVRGRCGNLYSPVPREPMAAVEEEPSEKAMEEPVRAAQLTASPEMQAEKPVEIEKFENPKSLAESFTNGGGLPVPQAEDALPPVWVAGGGMGGPGGGVMGVGGAGGVGGGSPGLPGTSAPENTPAGVTAPILPLVTQATSVEIPPPLVLMALTHPPSTPLIVEYPVFPPPELPNPPPSRPAPSEPPPVGTPPESQPPSGPPPSAPPASVPPPLGPPPSGPPPSGPPPFEPPTTPPPDNSVPEPGAWVLAVLGIGAIAVGSLRRKI